LYPYAITLPVEVLTSNWKAARAVWDGKAQIESGNQYTDYAGIDDGGLFVFGMPTTEQTIPFADRVHEALASVHSCTKLPDAAREVPVVGLNGRLYQQRCLGQLVFRLAFVRDHFGLVISLLVYPQAETTALDRFVKHVAAVKWTR
jgi:hypothetical protein